jgi:drug/metabolite transporter (DMT)-like permease
MNTIQTSFVSLKDWRDIFLLVIFWGSAFALTKLAVATLSPYWIVSIRVSFAAVFMTSFLLLYRLRFSPGLKDIAWFILFGLIGNALPFYLIAVATQTISSSLAGIYIAIVPLIALPLAATLLPNEKMTWVKMFVFVLGFVGVLFLVGPQTLLQINFSKKALWAQVLMIVAAFGYAATLVLVKKAPRYHPLVLSTGMFWASTLWIVPVALWIEPLGYQNITLMNGLYSIALGLFPTALAALILFSLIHRVGPGFVSLSNYLVPGVAVLIGLVFLGERLSWLDGLGLMIILGAVWVASRIR